MFCDLERIESVPSAGENKCFRWFMLAVFVLLSMPFSVTITGEMNLATVYDAILAAKLLTALDSNLCFNRTLSPTLIVGFLLLRL